MSGSAGLIELLRLWMPTVSTTGIFLLLLLYGRPSIAAAGQLWIEARRMRMEERSAERQEARALDTQRNSLTFDLLEAARAEVRELMEEIKRLRPLEIHAIHLDEALLHISRLLQAYDDVGMLEQATRDAQSFLVRVSRVKEATGVFAGEAQRLSSTIEVAARELPGEAERRGKE